MGAPRPQPEPRAETRPGPLCRLLTQVRRLLVLAVIVALVALAGKYYWFDRLDEEIRVRIERQLREHYPRLTVSVRSARRVVGQGVEIRGIQISEPGKGGRTLVEIDEISAECDTRLPDFVTRTPAIKSLRIERLKLRAERASSGHWNLAELLPLPSCASKSPPIATISEASFEIVDATQNPPCTWTLRNIQLSIAPEPAVPPASETVLALRGSMAGDYLDKVTILGSLNPRTGAWQLGGDVEGLEFSPRLRTALPRELSQSLAPLSSVRGRTHFHFEVNRAAASTHSVREAGGSSAGTQLLPPVQFLVQGQIAEGRIDDARLPEPLTDVAASLRCDNRGITIEQLAARCGHTQIALTARIDGYDAASPFSADLNVKQLSLDRLNVASLPAELQEVWQRFSPRGTIDLAGKLSFDGSRFVPDFTVRCRDLSVQYDRYPYRVTDGTGTIRVQPDFVSVRLRTIGGGGRTIECRADVRQPGPHFTGWIEVQTEGAIPIEDRLLAALEPSTQKVVRAFQPRGAVSFQGRMERDPGEPQCHRKLSIQLHDCSIQHDKFRYPIDKVGGSLELTDDDWLFRNLSGRNDSAYIVGAGSWASDGSGQSVLDLKFTATDVPLADELRQAVSSETQRLWANLRPRGNIDHLTVGLRYDGEQTSLQVNAEKWPPEQNVEGRTLSIEPMWFRYRLDNLTGSFRYRDGVLELSKLEANHGRTSIAAEGVCRDLGDGSSRLELSRLAADRVEIDEDLLAAVPERLSQALSRLSVAGSLNLLGRLGMTVPAGSDLPPALDWDLSLNLAGGSIRASLPVEHVHGGLRLVGGSGPEGLVTRGELSVDSAMVRGVQLTNIQGPLWSDGQRLVFGPRADIGQKTPRPLTADIFEGQLVTEGEVALVDEGRFHVHAALEDSNLAQMARQLAPRQSGLSGRVFGVVNITGTSAGRHTWRGGGKLRLRDADIYEVPAMVAMLKLLSVQRPDRTAFSTSEIDFRIEGDDLALERIDFSGDAISLKGEGRVNMERQVSLKFYPVMGREERQIPLFRPLLGETGRQFMLIEVTGTLDRPDFHRTVLPKLDDRLRELFPELAREELVEPAMPILTAPRQALDRLNLLPKR